MEVNRNNMYVVVNDKVIERPNHNRTGMPSLTIDKAEQETTVTISAQGREKAAQETDAFAALREKEAPGAVSNDKAPETAEEKIEKRIKELKQKIEELLQQLTEKASSGSSEEEIKQIETELAVLQAELLSLMNQKQKSQNTTTIA